MKRVWKSFVSIMLTMFLLVGSFAVCPETAEAASYPVAIANNVYASVGETAYIFYQYSPAFKNEELIVAIYDSSNNLIGRTSNMFENPYKTIKYYTVEWNTAGIAAGTYKAVITKRFYSYYQWNTAPTTSTSYIYLSDDLNGVKGNNLYNGSDTIFSCIQNGVQTAENNHICNAMSAWQTTSFPYYNVQLKELYTGETADKIVKEENMYNPYAPNGTQWYLMKWEITNKSAGTLRALDVIKTFYKYNGARISVLDTPSFMGERENQDIYSVTIDPGQMEETWVGILVPLCQQVPYIKIDNTYLNINPAYAATRNTTTHRAVRDAGVSPTCTVDGLTDGEHCSACGQVITPQTVINAIGHDWDNGTLTDDGYKVYKCLNIGCAEIKKEKAPASAQKAQKITTAKIKSYKASSLKKKSVSFSLKAKASGKGKLTYKVTMYPKGMKKFITVNKNGKVTLKKGIKKGLYKITIKAAAKGKYKEASKVVKIQVK